MAPISQNTKKTNTSSIPAWKGFHGQSWQEKIDVAAFIQENINRYDGDERFLAAPSPATQALQNRVIELLQAEGKATGGVLDVDTEQVTSITAHAPGYIDEAQESIVGLQIDAPLKRAVNPWGGLRMAVGSCKAYGFEFAPELVDIFSTYRRTHNEGVFRA
jgi:formate C-acetyltransferase